MKNTITWEKEQEEVRATIKKIQVADGQIAFVGVNAIFYPFGIPTPTNVDNFTQLLKSGIAN